MLCTSDMFENCKTSVKGNKLEFQASVSSQGLEDEDFKGTKEEVKASLEEDEYTCK